MTEMYAERLKRINNEWGNEELINGEDIDWLIKQTELYEELFLVYTGLQGDVSLFNEKCMDLEKENERLRSEIEKAAHHLAKYNVSDDYTLSTITDRLLRVI